MPGIGMPYEAKKRQGCCYNAHVCVSKYGTFLFQETRKKDGSLVHLMVYKRRLFIMKIGSGLKHGRIS